MSDIPFLYGELNKQVEYLRYKFTSTDGTAIVLQNDSNNTIDLSINTSSLVTLKQVKKDDSSLDDTIKYYSLYAYNSATNAFDQKIGDEIVVDTSVTDDILSTITDAWILVGEEFIFDDSGNLLFNEDGTPMIKPVYEKVPTVIDTETGKLQLGRIPVSALVDTTVEGTLINSVLDANSGGVY